MSLKICVFSLVFSLNTSWGQQKYWNPCDCSTVFTVLASKDSMKYFEQMSSCNHLPIEDKVNRISTDIWEVIRGPLYPDCALEACHSNSRNNTIVMDSVVERFVLPKKHASNKVTTCMRQGLGTIANIRVDAIPLKTFNQTIYFVFDKLFGQHVL